MGFNTSPLPEAKAGMQSIKNGQSLPSSRAVSLSSCSSIKSLKYLFNAFKRNAASDDPPPKPAPAGITLCRWIF
jgi:hypothetical protein